MNLSHPYRPRARTRNRTRQRARWALALLLMASPSVFAAQAEWVAQAVEADARQPLRVATVVAESEAACNATLDSLQAQGMVAMEPCAPASSAIVDPNNDPDSSNNGRKKPARPRK